MEKFSVFSGLRGIVEKVNGCVTFKVVLEVTVIEGEARKMGGCVYLKVVSEFILTEGWVEFKPQVPNWFPDIFLIVSLYRIISKDYRYKLG